MHARSGGLSLGYLSNAAQECTRSNSSGVLKPSLTYFNWRAKHFMTKYNIYRCFVLQYAIINSAENHHTKFAHNFNFKKSASLNAYWR